MRLRKGSGPVKGRDQSAAPTASYAPRCPRPGVRSRPSSWIQIRTSVPPSTDEPIRTSPPVSSASRRTMSRPSPVDPALPDPRPRAIAASGSRMPGPASETSTITASSPLCTSTAKAVPSGVCRKTLPSRASSAATRSARATGMRTGRSTPATRTLRPSSSASADQNAIRSRTTSAASHPAPGPAAAVCGLASLAVRMMVSTSRSSWATAARVCSAAGPSPSEAVLSRSTVRGYAADGTGRPPAPARSRAVVRPGRPWS